MTNLKAKLAELAGTPKILPYNVLFSKQKLQFKKLLTLIALFTAYHAFCLPRLPCSQLRCITGVRSATGDPNLRNVKK